MLPLPPTQVSSLWSAVSWKLGSIIDIATISLCAEWAYSTLWTCFSCPLHPPFSKAMYLLVKTGLRCQLDGWSSGAPADVCPNPPPEIRLHPGDHPCEWPQSSGTRGPVLSPAPTATLALLPESSLSAQRVSVARQLDGKAGKMHVLHMCPPNLSRSEFHLPCGWVPLGFRKPSLPQQVWDSSPKGWLWNRWNTFCDFGPKQHSKFGMNMSFGTNPKLSVWGSWLDLWVGFLVGWAGLGVLVVFYQ